MVSPRSARNVNREWRFVVNLPGEEGEDDFVQSVKIQRCLRSGESCNIEPSGFSSTVCRYYLASHTSFNLTFLRQKYNIKKMLAINRNGTQYVDTFRQADNYVF